MHLPSSDLSMPFSHEDLHQPITSLSTGKAMGPDLIPNEFLKHMSDSSLQVLLDLINSCWISGSFPKTWAHSLIIPILKPGKDPTQTSSYRPIRLLSCPGKVHEKLVHSRLSWWVETNDVLPPWQYAFRPRRGTVDCLLEFEHCVYTAFRNKSFTIVTFIDLQSAFDSAVHLRILATLSDNGLHGRPLLWLKNFLAARSFSVSVGNQQSRRVFECRGVPQGSILSPLLFTVMLQNIPLPHGTKILAFADDIALLVSSPSLVEAETIMQQAVHSFSFWTNTCGLRINPEKSAVMCLTRRRIPFIPTVVLNSHPLPFVTKHRYLGLYIDGPSLTWAHHITYLQSSCLRRIDVLKRISGVHWGANRALLLRYYQAAIESKLKYGAEVYGSASPSLLKKLNIIQNAAIRICLGAFRSSPIAALLAETGLLPLHLQRELQVTKYLLKVSTYPRSHPLYNLYYSFLDSPCLHNWGTRHQPFIVRAISHYLTQGISIPQFSPGSALTPLSPSCFSQIFFGFSLEKWNRRNTPQEGQQLFFHLFNTNYIDFFPIFTDGSKITAPASTSSAIYLPHFQLTRTWKLLPEHSIVFAELYAIFQALLFAEQFLPPQKVIIFCDSKVALQIIATPKPHSYHRIYYHIHSCLLKLFSTPSWVIHFQWVPSHIGITPNEIVDKAAHLAHTLVSLTITSLEIRETGGLLNKVYRALWDQELQPFLFTSHLGQFRVDSSAHPHTYISHNRRLDTAFTRLRIGHTRLNSHLCRLGITGQPFCPWCPTIVEDIPHFLLHCPKYLIARSLLLQSLYPLGHSVLTLPILLDATNTPLQYVNAVIDATCQFLLHTGELHRI